MAGGTTFTFVADGIEAAYAQAQRLLDGLPAGRPTLELVRVLEAPGVAHLRYRVTR